MRNGTVRLAIIGCGGMGESHLQAYRRIREKEPEKFELIAVCDVVLERAQRLAEQTEQFQGSKPRVYTDIEKMLSGEELDGADICTTHADHHKSGVACLNAGVNVLIEKPFGVTVRASKLIIEAARRNGKIAATAENVRRGLSQRTARWLLNDLQLIGEPRLFYAQHARWQPPDEVPNWHWRVDKYLGGGGMVMDSGAHFCDTIRYLFGDVDTVYAKVCQLEQRPHRKGTEIVNDAREDTWLATLTFKSGLIGFWSWTVSAPGSKFTHIVYYGSKGALVDSGDVFHGPFSQGSVNLLDGSFHRMSDLQVEFLATLSEEERNRLFPHGFTDGVTLECYDFLDAIQHNRPPEVDGETGLKAKAICEAIFESAYCGQAVKVQDVLDGKVEEYQREINEYWGI